MKLRNCIKRIPKPVKIIFCILGIFFLSVTFYIACGSPTFTMEQEFRRAEKAHMVGPSTIVHTMGGYYKDYEKVIVGETEHGVCFFGRYSVNSGNYEPTRTITKYDFAYHEKTGDMTIMVAPNRHAWFWKILGGVSLPVYLFDEYHQAVRGEIEMTITGEEHYYDMDGQVTVSFNQTFKSSSERSKDGFFLFWVDAKTEQECYALKLLSNVGNSELMLDDALGKTVIPVTIKLYDAHGKLVAEKVLEIRP